MGVGEDAVNKALHLRLKDFEDALQYYAAKQANPNYIITRKKKILYSRTSPYLNPASSCRGDFLIDSLH